MSAVPLQFGCHIATPLIALLGAHPAALSLGFGSCSGMVFRYGHQDFFSIGLPKVSLCDV